MYGVGEETRAHFAIAARMENRLNLVTRKLAKVHYRHEVDATRLSATRVADGRTKEVSRERSEGSSHNIIIAALLRQARCSYSWLT